MSKFKISKSFLKLSDADLIAFVERLIESLTGNATYPTPAPSLASLTTLKTDFENALAAAADGGKTLTAIKNQKRTPLLDAVYQLANYVEGVALGDEVKLLSSGFEVYNTARSPRPLPAVPTGLRISDGPHSGTVKAKVDPVKEADVYELRYSQDKYSDVMSWKTQPASTSTTIIIENLTVGINIWVQVRSNNSRGYSEWCDPATLLVR